MPARSAPVDDHAIQTTAMAPSPKPSRPKRPARIKLGKVETTKKPSPTAPTNEPSEKHANRKYLNKASVRTGDPAKKRLSLLDAAGQILDQLSTKEAQIGLSAVEILERIQKAKLWSSPNGRTPHATLYAGMIRKIAARGDDARFRRVGPGKFSRNDAIPSRPSRRNNKKITNLASHSKKAAAKGGA